MTPVHVDPIDLLLTHLGGTFGDAPGCVELVAFVRKYNTLGLLPRFAVVGRDADGLLVFRCALSTAQLENFCRHLRVDGWADVWSVDLAALAADVQATIVDGRVVR